MRRFTTPMIVLALAAAPALVQAQTPQRGMMMGNPAERILSLREELGLSAQQILQIQRIAGQLQEQNRALREQLVQERPMMRRMEMRRDSMQAMTAEQREQMRTRMQERAGAVRERMQERREEMRARMEAQRPEMRARMEEPRARMGEVRARMEQRRDSMQALSPEQRDQARARMREEMQARRPEAGDRPQMRRPGAAMMLGRAMAATPEMEQLRRNMQDAMEQIRATLTPEQRAKLEQLRPAAGSMSGRGPAPRR